MDAVHGWVDRLGDLPPAYIYAVLALVALVEVGSLLGLFAPAEPVLLFAGLLTATGHLDLTTTLLVATAAALAGDTLGYLAGRHRSDRIRASRLGRFVGEDRWARAEDMFTRGRGAGGFAVMLARWVAFARTLMPRLAGAAGMSYGRFAPWNAVGVLVWVPGSVMLGRLAGSAYPAAASVPGWIGGPVVVLAIGAGIVAVVRRRRRRRTDQSPPEPSGEPGARVVLPSQRRFDGSSAAAREDTAA